jgi:Tfp pilus assembly protein PilN
VIRTNLSTRPFYNERAVHFWMLVGAIVVAAATAFNVRSVLRYSHSDTQLATEAAANEARAADLRRQAAQLRATVDPKQVEYASAEAHQANTLIDRRTFSWTELLNRFETTLPDEVRIAAVRPRLDKSKAIVLVINVVARGVEDVDEFMQNLEQTGAFATPLSREEHFNEQGLLESTIETAYVPEAARSAEGGRGEPGPKATKGMARK